MSGLYSTSFSPWFSRKYIYLHFISCYSVHIRAPLDFSQIWLLKTCSLFCTFTHINLTSYEELWKMSTGMYLITYRQARIEEGSTKVYEPVFTEKESLKRYESYTNRATAPAIYLATKISFASSRVPVLSKVATARGPNAISAVILDNKYIRDLATKIDITKCTTYRLL